MTDAADLRTVYGTGAQAPGAQRRASDAILKNWFAKGIPAWHRQQIAEILLRRIDEKQRVLSDTQKRAIGQLRGEQMKLLALLLGAVIHALSLSALHGRSRLRLGACQRALLRAPADPLGRATTDNVVTRLRFRVESLPNESAEEFLLDAVDGVPAAWQKRLILRAHDPALRLINDAPATRLIDALGLREA